MEPSLVIALIIGVFVIALLITMRVLNNSVKTVISTYTKMAESQNELLASNKQLEKENTKLKKQISVLEERKQHQNVAETTPNLPSKETLATTKEDPQEESQTTLQEENPQEISQDIILEEPQEEIDEAANAELMAWVDQKVDELQIFTDPDLNLKSLAKALGLTQRRVVALFKSQHQYANLGDYLNYKRFTLACRLLREKPELTIEAVGTEAGFGSRRTFQMEVKRRFGITPVQYRQGVEPLIN